MAKVKQAFKACIGGEVYPRHFEVGQEVAGEEAKVAKALGCLETAAEAKAAAKAKAAAETAAAEGNAG